MRKSERIALRIEPQLREKLERLTKAGAFKNLSEVARAALSKFLAEQNKG